MKQLNEFLGTGCSEELCEKIADACSFDNMKQFKETTSSEILKSLFRNNKNNFYRKGIDNKNNFYRKDTDNKNNSTEKILPVNRNFKLHVI